MAKTIEQLLGLPALMGLIEETTTGLPQEQILPGEFRTLTRDVVGNSALATLTRGQRKTTKLIKYNAAPVGAALETIATKPWVLMHSSEELPINPVTFQQLRAYDNWEIQKQGLHEIGRQIGLFKQKNANLEVTSIMMALTKPAIYFDSNGNLLPSSSGADANNTIDLGVSANHRDQLNGIIAAPWDNPSTNIPLHLRNLRKQAAKDTGYLPEICVYGENVPGYIQTNAYCKDYLARNPAMNAKFMTSGEIPDGFLDMTWVPGYLAFFEDADGTNQSILDGDAACFFPKPSKNWYELLRGSMQIPKTLNPVQNVESAMDNLEVIYGMFAYAHLSMKPVRLDVIVGNTFLPTLKNPDVVWQASVAGF